MTNSIQTSYQLKSLQIEYEYYEDKLKDEARVRAIYHDLKNHLLIVQSANSSEAAGKMIDTIQEQIAGYENYYKTGNAFLDVIIRDKAEKARKHNIDFSAMLHFEGGSFMQPLDISTIMGNALDNAVEASLKLPANKRLITVKAGRIHDMLSIVIENHVATESNLQLKSQKADKLLHGFGMMNIEQAVSKYDGQFTAVQNDGRFALSIIIPIP